MKKFLIITGLSGAGKSTALKSLEDIGFFCVDNLPLVLIPQFIDVISPFSKKVESVAIVVDIREKKFLQQIESTIEFLKKRDIDYDIIYLEAQEEVILRRYSETRRIHPLGNIKEGIKIEESVLLPLKENAKHIIDTSHMTVHMVRDAITAIYGPKRAFYINIIAFGFRYGLPQNADLVLDVRFLPNPYFHPELKNHTGIDRNVKEFLLNKDITRKFLRRVISLLNFLVPHYQREAKIYLTIGIGCTGGRHRSIVIADYLGNYLSKKGYNAKIIHRDVGKGVFGDGA